MYYHGVRSHLPFSSLIRVLAVGLMLLLFLIPLLQQQQLVKFLPQVLQGFTGPEASKTMPVVRIDGLAFVENAGQFAQEARFQARGDGYTLWLADDALWITILQVKDQSTGNRDDGIPTFPVLGRQSPTLPARGVTLKVSFPNANPASGLAPFGQRDTTVSYLRGDNPARWQANVVTWSGVRYRALYPGIDLVIGGENGRLEPRLICRSDCASSLQQVRLRVEGATGLVEGSLPQVLGDALSLTTVLGDIELPLLQVEGGGLDASPEIRDLGGGTFEVIAPFAPLASPQGSQLLGEADLLYSTFLGGSVWDEGRGVAVDEAGNAYVTGYTSSTDFPVTPGAFDETAGQYSDVFVAKLNADGSELVYATYLGGDYFEEGEAIAVDAGGNAIVTGYTHSTDFPTTPGAYDTTCGTDGYCNAGPGIPTDAFVVKLNTDGSDLVYGTYLGASSSDHGYGIVLDETGSAYIAGSTGSPDFPTTPEAYDTSFNGYDDAFVARLDPTGSDLTYGTFVGGSDKDEAYAITLDGDENVYLTGMTRSPNFPTTPDAFDPSCGTDGACNGLNEDAFAVKLNAEGTDLDYSTFLGGALYEQGLAIATGEAGHAHVGGYTVSSDFPTTIGAFDTNYSGLTDAFVTKVAPDGTALSYSTFLGSTGGESAFGIDVDEMGYAYVTGGTNSDDFPTTPDGFDTTYGGGLCGDPPYQTPCPDVFVTKLSPDGSAVDYGTYMGGDDWDYGYALTLDPCDVCANQVYLTGQAYPGFPTTPGAYDTTQNGYCDAFVAKLATGLAANFYGTPVEGVAPLTVVFTNLSTGEYTENLWNFGDGITSTLESPTHTYTMPMSYTVTLAISGAVGSDTLVRPNYIAVYAPVQAGFTAAPLTGTAPLTVTFTNASSGDYDESLWKFGDGVTSTRESPTHTYSVADVYTASLTVSGPGGTDALTRTNYITVYAPVQAGFTAWPTSGVAPLEVSFDNTSTGDYTESLWDLGDGITSTLESPTHTYTMPASYTVTLTVSGPGGIATETKIAYITVREVYNVYLPLILRQSP